MQLIYSPTLLPGCCFICKGAQRESYLDTGVSLDYEGAFYICNMCVNEAAHIMSYISHDEYKDLRASKEQLGIAVTMTVLLLSLAVIFLKMWTSQSKEFTSQRLHWELERERLLNRCMTLHWETYAQMSQTQIPISSSISESSVGMSDEEELRRHAAMYSQMQGVGEELLDMGDELRELGIEVQ